MGTGGLSGKPDKLLEMPLLRLVDIGQFRCIIGFIELRRMSLCESWPTRSVKSVFNVDKNEREHLSPSAVEKIAG